MVIINKIIIRNSNHNNNNKINKTVKIMGFITNDMGSWFKFSTYFTS